MRMIEDCARFLGTDQWGVFAAWANHHNRPQEKAEEYYEDYCEVGTVHQDIYNFALDILAKRLRVQRKARKKARQQ